MLLLDCFALPIFVKRQGEWRDSPSHLIGDDDALRLRLRLVLHRARQPRVVLGSRAAELLNQDKAGGDGGEREGDAGEGDAPLWEVGTRRTRKAV